MRNSWTKKLWLRPFLLHRLHDAASLLAWYRLSAKETGLSRRLIRPPSFLAFVSNVKARGEGLRDQLFLLASSVTSGSWSSFVRTVCGEFRGSFRLVKFCPLIALPAVISWEGNCFVEGVRSWRLTGIKGWFVVYSSTAFNFKKAMQNNTFFHLQNWLLPFHMIYKSINNDLCNFLFLFPPHQRRRIVIGKSETRKLKNYLCGRLVKIINLKMKTRSDWIMLIIYEKSLHRGARPTNLRWSRRVTFAINDNSVDALMPELFPWVSSTYLQESFLESINIPSMPFVCTMQSESSCVSVDYQDISLIGVTLSSTDACLENVENSSKLLLWVWIFNCKCCSVGSTCFLVWKDSHFMRLTPSERCFSLSCVVYQDGYLQTREVAFFKCQKQENVSE